MRCKKKKPGALLRGPGNRSPFGCWVPKQRYDTSFLCQQTQGLLIFLGASVERCNDATPLLRMAGAEKDDRVSEFGTFAIPCGLVNLSPPSRNKGLIRPY